jgi:hypothetical protein
MPKPKPRDRSITRAIEMPDEMWDAVGRCAQKLGGLAKSAVVRQAVVQFLIANGFVLGAEE